MRSHPAENSVRLLQPVLQALHLDRALLADTHGPCAHVDVEEHFHVLVQARRVHHPGNRDRHSWSLGRPAARTCLITRQTGPVRDDEPEMDSMKNLTEFAQEVLTSALLGTKHLLRAIREKLDG